MTPSISVDQVDRHNHSEVILQMFHGNIQGWICTQRGLYMGKNMVASPPS